jgi:transcriptional regulator with XRE-family HTH domain
VIQRLREEKGWTQAELGVYARLGASTVSLLE